MAVLGSVKQKSGQSERGEKNTNQVYHARWYKERLRQNAGTVSRWQPRQPFPFEIVGQVSAEDGCFRIERQPTVSGKEVTSDPTSPHQESMRSILVLKTLWSG